MKIKKIIKNLTFLFCPIIFVTCISVLSVLTKGIDIKSVLNKTASPNGGVLTNQTQPTIQTSTSNKKQEIRAIWVPFMDLDMKSECSLERFEKKIDEIITTSKNSKINTIIVHVRSHSDALYPSKIFPWSHRLTGVQGQDPGFDPLKIMIEKIHNESMEFHAWINPFRIQCAGSPKNICETNPAYSLSKKPDCVLKYDNGTYYNPAKEEVQRIVVEGIKEVVQNYAVDAIHLDDRFYPTDKEDFDRESYKQYLENVQSERLDLYTWRRQNINNLVSKIYKEIKSIKSDVLLGIAPEGNINNAENHGADVKKWCSKPGYVDYICPQLYWSLDNPTLDFKTAANNWKSMLKSDNVKLYFGLSLYKIGTDLDNNTWKLYDNDILKREIEYSRSLGCEGFMLYPYNCLNKPETQKELLNIKKVFS